MRCRFITLICLTLFSAWGSESLSSQEGLGRVIVIGMDGMDPVVLQRMMAADMMPNFTQLTEMGSFTPLATSMPPQSPVAWANVISGGEPGGHEIYDFIHRDPKPKTKGLAIIPYLSTSSTEHSGKSSLGISLLLAGVLVAAVIFVGGLIRGRLIAGALVVGLLFIALLLVYVFVDEVPMGKWRFPLASQRVQLRREGPAFWDFLVQHGVNTTIYRMPANYPVQHVGGHGQFQCLAGMGTPDLLGSYGEFTVYTSEAPIRGRIVSGGRFVYLWPENDRAKAELEGPPNHLYKPDENGQVPNLTIPFHIVRHPQRDEVKITLDDNLFILKKDEWSPFIQFEFQTGVPLSTVPGMVRFHIKQVHPELKVFVTPINIDPTRPINPISVPENFARDLAENTGLYFTAGIPEHTPEIQQSALNEDQWLHKAYLILDQRTKQFHRALAEFESGCLFYYFGSPDLLSHIFWRDQDPDHPGRDPDQGDRYADVIEQVYLRMDGIVGAAIQKVRDHDTLIIMSDHGFASFSWGFNLNTWLLENGYITLLDPSRQEKAEFFSNVDWSRTKAYGLGLNGLYLNQRGREKRGIVNQGAESERVLKEISEKLLAVKDDRGVSVVAKTYLVAENYADADPDVAPDILVGYARSFRASWETVLGGMPKDLIVVNDNRWSGDHCIAADLVPGILVTNRRITVDDPNLSDVAPTILSLFQVEAPPAMIGRPILQTN